MLSHHLYYIFIHLKTPIVRIHTYTLVGYCFIFYLVAVTRTLSALSRKTTSRNEDRLDDSLNEREDNGQERMSVVSFFKDKKQDMESAQCHKESLPNRCSIDSCSVLKDQHDSLNDQCDSHSDQCDSHSDQHDSLNDQHDPHSDQHDSLNDQHDSLNDQHDPHSDQHDSLNDQHESHSDQQESFSDHYDVPSNQNITPLSPPHFSTLLQRSFPDESLPHHSLPLALLLKKKGLLANETSRPQSEQAATRSNSNINDTCTNDETKRNTRSAKSSCNFDLEDISTYKGRVNVFYNAHTHVHMVFVALYYLFVCLF